MLNHKILVVDDSQTVRIKINRILVNAGYEVVTACDGLEAIEKLSEEFSLIVLDVNMPHLDGYGVCEKLRSFGPKYEDMPVVFLTSLESKALELLGREFGAYLHKPVTEEKLLSVVEAQLSQPSTH